MPRTLQIKENDIHIKTISLVISPGNSLDMKELDQMTNQLLIRGENKMGQAVYADVKDIQDTLTPLAPFGPKERVLFTRRITYR
jgi:hypothetical protein